MASKKYYTDKELYEILMNSDSEDEVISAPEDSEEDDEWENISDVLFPDQDIEGASDISDSDNEGATQPSKKRKTTVDEPNFKWQKADLIPILHDFDDGNSGCQIQNITEKSSALEIFESFITHEIVQEMVTQTKIYYDSFVSENSDKATKNYKPVDVDEMYVFLAISLLMPLVKKQKIKDYWSKDIIIETPIFGQVMPRDRYSFLLRFLHFADNSNVDREDKLFKIRCIVDHCRTTFKKSLYPFQNLVIDESLLLFKGRLSFRQFIPSKRHRFGVKFFVMVDCDTGYILDFIIYTGGSTEITEIDKRLGKSGNIVMTLTEPFWNKGHRLYTDNWYTSPLLYDALFDKKTNCCGTVKANRQFMPKFEKTKVKGTTQFFSTDRLLALKWTDKRDVHMLTSIHNNAMGVAKISRNEEVVKPTCVIDYNSNMGGVDRTDMLLSTTESVRKTVKWYKKVFFHFLDFAVLNSHVIYKMKTGENIPLLDFQKEVVRSLIKEHKKIQPRNSPGSRPDHAHSPLRLIERHFPSTYSCQPGSNKKIVKRCVVCAKRQKRKSTTFTCKKCDVPLCADGCFERYHTVLKF